MTLRGDSFSSVTSVLTFTKRLLDGQTNFNSTTTISLSEVEAIIDRVSGVLNGAISAAGFTPSNVRSNSTAKLACDDWTVSKAVVQVELTERGTGYSKKEGSRTAVFAGLYDDATDFVKMSALGWKRFGITVTVKSSDGLKFTGEQAQKDRADPDDKTLEQPKFKRGMFGDRSAANFQESEP